MTPKSFFKHEGHYGHKGKPLCYFVPLCLILEYMFYNVAYLTGKKLMRQVRNNLIF